MKSPAKAIKASNKAPASAEPKLVLAPFIRNMTREDLERFIDEVRAKRLTAAVVYHSGKNAKLEHAIEITKRRIAQKLGMLDRAMDTVDKAVDRMQKYMDEVQILEHNLTLTQDQITVLDKAEADE